MFFYWNLQVSVDHLPSSTPRLLKIFLPARFCMVLMSIHIKVHRNSTHVNPSLSKKKKKKGLRFLLCEFYWNIPFMSLHTEERLDSVTAAFTPTHLLPYCYSYLFSGDLRNYPPKKKGPSPLGPWRQRSKSLQHSCTVTWIMLWSCLKIAFLIWTLPFDRWVSNSGVQQGQCPSSPCRCTACVRKAQQPVCEWRFTGRDVRQGIAELPSNKRRNRKINFGCAGFNWLHKLLGWLRDGKQ